MPTTIAIPDIVLTPEEWQFAGAVVGSLLVGLLTFYYGVKGWAASAYDSLKASSPSECDIDEFCGSQNPPSKVKVMIAHKLRVGSRVPSTEPIPLECIESPHVQGLWITKAKGTNDDATPLEDLIPRKTVQGFMDKRDKHETLVVATIRMGFGHHRLAYSACSWALSQGYTTIFHDFVNIESEESKLVGSADTIYSRMSRLSTEIGGPIEYLWGQVR